MKTLKSSVTSAGKTMKRFSLALLSLTLINTVLDAKSQFEERNPVKEIFKKTEIYEGYLKHRMPVTLQLTGALPQSFNWGQYKWESNFPKQEIQNSFVVSTPYTEISERQKRMEESMKGLPELPGISDSSVGDGSENKITVGEKVPGISEKQTDRSGQELLEEEDIVELFGKESNRMTDGSEATSFEVPNSGFAPAPVLKNDAIYSKE